jgi:demethylmenaquinone methyltransferase/2-methoxy-6-polyprenyl-1,4-benzoquinol methylase
MSEYLYSKEPMTDFGYQKISFSEKTKKVGEIFSSVARHYDLMNDLMSFGIHRYWKRFAVELAMIQPGQKILDLATGSGDLGLLMAKKMKGKGTLILSDINPQMLKSAQDHLIDQGVVEGVSYVLANAEVLPFQDHHFDRITISFGLRNVADKLAALASIYRVLKPGGCCLILEFSKPIIPLLKKIYDLYSFSVIPWLGKVVAGDANSYRYLVESIQVHPNQEQLKQMLLQSGFDNCEYYNLSCGIVTLHRSYKA